MTMKNVTKTLVVITLFAATAVNRAHAADAKENWATHCAACHGKDGKGQTKAGRMAGVKDQTDAAYQATLKDDKMFSTIKDGLKEGDKEKMKPFKEKLSDDDIKALVA